MGFLTEIASTVLLFALVFGMSATVNMGRLWQQVQNWKALMIGISLQFIILPFCGFCVVKLFQLPVVTAMTLLVVTSSPGGSYSNWWCSMFNADLALSVTMTAVSTCLSCIFLPLNLMLYTRHLGHHDSQQQAQQEQQQQLEDGGSNETAAATATAAAPVEDDVTDHLDWAALMVSLVTVMGGIAAGLLSSQRATWLASQQANALAAASQQSNPQQQQQQQQPQDRPKALSTDMTVSSSEEFYEENHNDDNDDECDLEAASKTNSSISRSHAHHHRHPSQQGNSRTRTNEHRMDLQIDYVQRHQRRANLMGNLAGVSLITLSFAVSSSQPSSKLWDQDWTFYVGVGLPAALGLAIATYLATLLQLRKPERVAVAIESSYQNTGIAATVAMNMFSRGENSAELLAKAVSVPLYYGLVEAVLLFCFCVTAWKRGWTKAPPTENFCKMLYTTYEVENDDNDNNNNATDNKNDTEDEKNDTDNDKTSERSGNCSSSKNNRDSDTLKQPSTTMTNVVELPVLHLAAKARGGKGVSNRQQQQNEDIHDKDSTGDAASIESTDPSVWGTLYRRGVLALTRASTRATTTAQTSASSQQLPHQHSSSPCANGIMESTNSHKNGDATSVKDKTSSRIPASAQQQQQQQHPSPGEEVQEAGRLALAVSAIRAHATGYRHADRLAAQQPRTIQDDENESPTVRNSPHNNNKRRIVLPTTRASLDMDDTNDDHHHVAPNQKLEFDDDDDDEYMHCSVRRRRRNPLPTRDEDEMDHVQKSDAQGAVSSSSSSLEPPPMVGTAPAPVAGKASHTTTAAAAITTTSTTTTTTLKQVKSKLLSPYQSIPVHSPTHAQEERPDESSELDDDDNHVETLPVQCKRMD